MRQRYVTFFALDSLHSGALRARETSFRWRNQKSVQLQQRGCKCVPFALQSFYFDKIPIMSNEEFDNLDEELLWQGSKVPVLR